MNSFLYPFRKAVLTALCLLGLSGLSLAQQPCYLTATIKSSVNGAAIPGVSLFAFSYGTGNSQSATTNQQGVAYFQLPYYNTGLSNLWAITALHQGDSIVLDTFSFPSPGYQLAQTYYLNTGVTPNCNPAVTSSQIMGTMLWQFTADTTNFRQCFGYGWLAYTLTVDGQYVDSNGVSPNGIYNANQFTVSLTPGVHTVCIQVMGPQLPNSPQTCLTVIVGGVAQNIVQGMIRSNGAITQEDVLVELIGMNGQYRVDTVTWPMDSSWYHFGNVSPGYYYVRAIPLGGGNVATYYPSSLTWYGATAIEVPGLMMPPYPLYNIDLIGFMGSPGGGPNTIQGYINGGSGVTVTTTLPGSMGTATTSFTATNTTILVLNAQNQPVGYATVNPDGTFFIDGLPEGEYTLVMDHPLIANVQRPISFSATVHSASVQAVVTSSGFDVVTGSKQNLGQDVVSAFPNPTQNQVFIRNFEQVNTLTLVNVLGVETTLAPAASINLEGQAPGIYFIKGQTKAGDRFNLRLVKH